MLNDYNVELDEIDQYHVTLVIRALAPIVLGRTPGEAEQLAKQPSPRVARRMSGTGLKLPTVMATIARWQSTGSPESSRAA